MIAHRFSWFHKGEKVGELELRIVETRDEAEDPDHCWCVNSRIHEHLSICEVTEGYPALLIRWMEVNEDCQNEGHGTALLKFVQNFALKKNCVFCYCKLDMDDSDDLELQSFYLRRGWRLLEQIKQKRIYEPDDEACFVMGYIAPSINCCFDLGDYHEQEDEVPEWERRLRPTRYIPE